MEMPPTLISTWCFRMLSLDYEPSTIWVQADISSRDVRDNETNRLYSGWRVRSKVPTTPTRRPFRGPKNPDTSKCEHMLEGSVENKTYQKSGSVAVLTNF